MLHGRNNYLIARPHVLASVRVGDQIDGFRSTADKNDLPLLSGVDKSPDLISSGLVFLRGSFAQEMNAAMNIGVLRSVVMHDGTQYNLWLLTSGCVIQINKWLTINFLFQSRKIF